MNHAINKHAAQTAQAQFARYQDPSARPKNFSWRFFPVLVAQQACTTLALSPLRPKDAPPPTQAERLSCFDSAQAHAKQLLNAPSPWARHA